MFKDAQPDLTMPSRINLLKVLSSAGQVSTNGRVAMQITSANDTVLHHIVINTGENPLFIGKSGVTWVCVIFLFFFGSKIDCRAGTRQNLHKPDFFAVLCP